MSAKPSMSVSTDAAARGDHPLRPISFGTPAVHVERRDDGTIYLVRSGRGCGKNVRIVRYETADFDLVFSLADTRDIFLTHTSDEGDTNHVYYDQVNCRTNRWNIFKLTDPETP